MDREQRVVVGPGCGGPPAGGLGQRAEGFYGVFVRVRGVDRLALAEREAAARHADGLRAQAFKVHLDAMMRGTVEGAVAKRRDLETTAQFAVHATQNVEIEFRRDARRI